MKTLHPHQAAWARAHEAALSAPGSRHRLAAASAEVRLPPTDAAVTTGWGKRGSPRHRQERAGEGKRGIHVPALELIDQTVRAFGEEGI